MTRAVWMVSAICSVFLAGVPAGAQDRADGAALYQRHCASCHDAGVNRAPVRDAFQSMPADRVLASMETGSMVTMANNRTAAERRAIAEFLTGKAVGVPLVTTPSPDVMCRTRGAGFDADAGARWDGWGRNTSNTRFQQDAGLAAADVPRLQLKWAFAFPGDLQSYSQPTIAGGRVFVGSWGGKVYSLDASSGCVHWSHLLADARRAQPFALDLTRAGASDARPGGR